MEPEEAGPENEQETIGETLRVLRRHLRDQAALLALPAMWSSRPSTDIASDLVDVLHSLLRLDCAYVRIDDPGGVTAIEYWRPRLPDPPEALVRTVDPSRRLGASHETLVISVGTGPAALRVACTRPWFPGMSAAVVTASLRPTFPTELEQVLLRIAADQAMLAIHSARLLEREQAARLAAEAATRTRDEFLSIASHELRTPLTSLMANVQLAERLLRGLVQKDSTQDSTHDGTQDSTYDGTQDSTRDSAADEDTALLEVQRSALTRAHTLLDRTHRQVARLDRLVGDLLDVSRIQAGRLELRRERVDLFAIVREATEAQRAAWPGREIVLEPLPMPARELVVVADPDRIAQVLTNYLTNALKYSPAEGPVAVRLRTADDGPSRDGGDVVRVEVWDRGPGLAPEQQARLFERFFRVPGIEILSGSGVGLGLGLYICRTIVERHGGTVGVQSAPGAGSAFWFTLPLPSLAAQEQVRSGVGMRVDE